MNEETEEKKKLASFVKSVHKELRKKLKAGERDVEDIWKEHCQDKEKLHDYAEAMQKLATLHWGKQQLERVHWCRKMLVEYFKGGGMEKCIDKDCRRLQRLRGKDGLFDSTSKRTKDKPPLQQETENRYLDAMACLPEQPLVLDVGSCYNPFKQMLEFKVIGIDLHPATEDVYQCDFLSVEIGDTIPDSLVLSSPVTRLPSCTFNVIIFCLLLEYFPSCRQRWQCCVQAHKLLAPNGLLVIITPDSHKQHRNANMIRSWISAITAMGFSKYKYEKLEHIHCIVFRKNQEECCLKDEMVDHMFIHQDALEENFPADISGHRDETLIQSDIEFTRQAMLELPGLFSDTDD